MESFRNRTGWRSRLSTASPVWELVFRQVWGKVFNRVVDEMDGRDR